MGLVSLVRVRGSKVEIKDSVAEALDLIRYQPKKSVNSVSIKVNLCYYWNAASGQTTDPRLVAGIIDHLREEYGADVNIQVVESDATAMKTKHVFKMLGYEKLAKEKKIELHNLSMDEVDVRKVNVNGREIAFNIPSSLLKSDSFINVPKLKTAPETKITCALKNIFGCIASPRKIVYHPFLSEAIVGINKILQPNVTIVDGLVALGRYPVKLDLIMAGIDPYSVDWVASQIMGFNPSRIGFLRVARTEGIVKPRSIETCGENLNVLKREFPKPSLFYSRRWWRMQLRLLNLYASLVKDVVPPLLEQ